MDRKAKHLTYIVLGIIFLSSSISNANIYPPAPMAHFYGDANGDTVVSLVDQTQHSNAILLKSATYDTLQPALAKSDTCDVNSDNTCSLGDKTLLANVILLNTQSVFDKPWAITNPTVGGLPSSVNSSTSTVFQVSLASLNGTLRGRPGIPIVATIESGSGAISGRDCAPAAGTRDQPVVGQICALSVTITDWVADPTLGLTETGATGFAFEAPSSEGDTRILFTVNADPKLDIPLTTMSVTVTTIVPDVVSLTCPANSSESVDSQCTITATGPSSCTLGAATTCVGASIVGCSTVDIPAQGEASGPGFCFIEVIKGASSDLASITVDEANTAPSWSPVPPPWDPIPIARIEVANGATFSQIFGSINDWDYPNSLVTDPGFVTCTLYSNTCGFPVSYTGSGMGSVDCVLSFTAPETGMDSCSGTLVVTDGYGAYARQIVTISWSQTTYWTWMAGNNVGNALGNYGAMGTPSPSNTPGARRYPVSWKDAAGNFWLLGGYGKDQNASWGGMNDLWKWDGANWTWIGGSNLVSQPGIYGTLGMPDPANIPGGRNLSVAEQLPSGDVLVFGGQGVDSIGASGYLNDLWKWDGTNWTWLSGSSTINQYGVYGTKGVPASTNRPGAREGAVSWMDSSGNLWIFGGYGYAVSGAVGYLNDLWKWDGTNWTWIFGEAATNNNGYYGTKGVPSASTRPSSRRLGATWADSSGNLWLFGGYRYTSAAYYLSDVWKFDGVYWTWVSGTNSANQNGNYGTKGVAASTNIPGSRHSPISVEASNGDVLLYGGYGRAETGTASYLNDLWKWDGANWTWIDGSKTKDQTSIYGAKGIASPVNQVGGRYGGALWIDSDGNLWEFGGYGYAFIGPFYLNDLWKRGTGTAINYTPSISLECPPIPESVISGCTPTVSDPDSWLGQWIRCDLSTPTTCTGVIVDPNCEMVYIYEQGENAGGGTCILSVQVTDSWVPAMTAKSTVTINIYETNNIPIWPIQPIDLNVITGVPVNYTNGRAADLDLPNSGAADAGFVTCSVFSETCAGFDPIVTSSPGNGTANCALSFTPGAPETCSITLNGTDGYGAEANSNTFTLSVASDNSLPSVTSNCPTNATEGSVYNCALTATDPDTPIQSLTFSLAVADTCGGTVTGSTYSWVPSELQGGGTCVVGVQVSDNYSPPGVTVKTATVTVAEANANPVITANCTTEGIEWIAYQCDLTATDSDIPVQTLTWSKQASDTCGGTVSGSTYNWTPSEVWGSQGCYLRVTVSDDFSPPKSANYSIMVIVTETNEPVTITSTCPTSVDEGQTYVCLTSATDADIPVQNLIWYKTASDTCGGTLTDFNYYFNVVEGLTPGCIIGIQVQDSFSPMSVATQDTNLTVNRVNSPPLIANMPYSAEADLGESYNKTFGRGEDDDIPNSLPTDDGYVTCSVVSSTCGFPVSYTGSGSGTANCALSFVAPSSGSGQCEIEVQVTDGGGLTDWEPPSSPHRVAIIWPTHNWIWMNGNRIENPYEVSGPQGNPYIPHHPGRRSEGKIWADSSGNIWLIDGKGYYQDGSQGIHADIWKWNGTSWIFEGGNDGSGGNYGTKGVANPFNFMGGRAGFASWTDSVGNQWFFGGTRGFLMAFWGDWYYFYLNDLWKFNGSVWTWMSGSNTPDQPGVYGTKGVPAPTNIPGARSGSATWTDASSNLWLFGGYGYPFYTALGILNDLWKWDGTNWTWVSGSKYDNENGVYGTKGVPAPTNMPGSRRDAVSWVDSSGNFWLFGGMGYPEAGYYDYHLNDLWKWDGTNWTWVSGESTEWSYGVMGTMGVPDAANAPSARLGAASWTDSSGNLWMFGGYGLSGDGFYWGYLNDLWRWDGTYWTWMGGSGMPNQYSNFGTPGVPDPANQPGGRFNAQVTVDSFGDVWMYGGQVEAFPLDETYSSELWRWDGTNWTYIDGPPLPYGVYGTKGVSDPDNHPGERSDSVSWTDSSANLYVFGGYGYTDNYKHGTLNDLWKWDGAEWTWLSGSSNSTNELGIYGVKGVPASSNMPGSRKHASSGTDVTGDFLLFGGSGYSAVLDVTPRLLNDLWRWDGADWTWENGSDQVEQYGIYGTMGIPDPANSPGSREGAISWTDTSGDFYVFGGEGYSLYYAPGLLNDMWKWDGVNWTWIKGSSNSTGEFGVYGTEGVADPANIPGARRDAVTWVDGAGNIWLYGGWGIGISGQTGPKADLWKWDGTNWTWVYGNPGTNGLPNYGFRGIGALNTQPGGRYGSLAWVDLSGNLWLFGGEKGPSRDIDGLMNQFNDLWKWDGTMWTWMEGDYYPVSSDYEFMVMFGAYGTQGVANSTNQPGARLKGIAWVDPAGDLWMFGGRSYIGFWEYAPLNDMWKYNP